MTDPLVVDMFVYRLRSYIGAYFVHLKQPLALVFTGGIGEHSALIRKLALQNLEPLGCRIDEAANHNATDDSDISAASATLKTLVVKAREDLYVARQAAAFMA